MLRPVEPREGHLVSIVRIVSTEHGDETPGTEERVSSQTEKPADSFEQFEFRQKMDAAHDRWLLYLD